MNKKDISVITDKNYNIFSPQTAYGAMQLKYDNLFTNKNKS